MTDRKNREKIQRSMNHTFSGLTPDIFLAQRVLNQAGESKGKEKMKNKLSGSMVFAVILVLLLATAAVAITNWENLKKYFETVRVMDTEGELARWSDTDKVKLLSAMVAAGIVTDQEEGVQTALDAALPLKERGSAADTVITKRYGASYFDSHTVEQMEFPEKERSPEEEADFEAWSQEYWNQWDGRGKQPLTEGRIYRANMSNLTEIGEFPPSLLRDVTVASTWDEQKMVHVVTASIDKTTYMKAKERPDQISLFDPEGAGYEQDGKLHFQFWLDEYGAFLGVHNPNSPAARAQISLEEGQRIAEKALKVRLNVDKSTLDGLPLQANYGEGSTYIQEEGRFHAVCTYIWGTTDESAHYMASIDAITGQVIKAFDWHESNAMLKKEQAWIADLEGKLEAAGVSGNLQNQQEVYIWQWTLKERAAWSRVARPIVQAYLKEHPEFANYLEDLLAHRYAQHTWPNLIALTQYAYGEPEENAIPQDKAFATAREEAIRRGAKMKHVDDNKNHIVYYDVTNPERPLWKVLVNTQFGADDQEHPYNPTEPWGYFVVMDAKTGEVLKVIERSANTRIKEIV